MTERFREDPQEESPPFFSSWNHWYLLVLLVLVAFITFLYFFTQAFE